MGDANCTISIANYGAIRVKCTRLVHGMSVVAYNSGGESRHGHAYYPSKRTSGSFEMTIQFGSYAGYHRVNRWLKKYMIWAGSPRSLATPVRVIVPNRRFDKVGALEGGVIFGDSVGATTYRIELALVGARDPMEMGGKTLISRYRPPKGNTDPSVPFFYPAGVQLSGGENGWDTAYDMPSDEPGIPDDTHIDLPDIDLPEIW